MNEGRKTTGSGKDHHRRPQEQRSAPEPWAPSSQDTNSERHSDGGTQATRPGLPRAPRAPGPQLQGQRRCRARCHGPQWQPVASPVPVASPAPRPRPHLHPLAVVQQHVPQLLGDHVQLPFLPFRRSRQQIHPRERRIQSVKLPVYGENGPNFNERPWAASAPTAPGPGNPVWDTALSPAPHSRLYAQPTSRSVPAAFTGGAARSEPQADVGPSLPEVLLQARSQTTRGGLTGIFTDA